MALTSERGALADGMALKGRWPGPAELALCDLTSVVGLWFVVRHLPLGTQFGPVEGMEYLALQGRFIRRFAVAFVCVSVFLHVVVRLILASGS